MSSISGALRVPCVTVDDFCTSKNISPDFIRIDVERSRLEVLRGAWKTIQSAGKEFALFVELPPGLWPGLGWSRTDLEREFTNEGLRLEPWERSSDPWTEDPRVALRIRRQSKPGGQYD